MNRNTVIKHFAQHTLGCSCAEEVFTSIIEDDDIIVSEELTVSKRILIGERLLIYIVEAQNMFFIEKNLISLLNAGKNDRDENAYNRFRLVLVSDVTDRDIMKAQAMFALHSGSDEKLHLHVYSKDEIEGLL